MDEIAKLKASIALVMTKWGEASEKFDPVLRKHTSEIKEMGTTTKATADQVEELGATILKLQGEFEALRTALADAEANDGGDDAGDDDTAQLCSPGTRFMKSSQMETWQKDKGHRWQSERATINTKGGLSGDIFGTNSNAAGLQDQFYNRDAPDQNRRQGQIIRGLCTIIPVGDVGSIRTKVEVAEYSLVCLLTEAIGASGSPGARTIKVDRLAGFKLTSPYNLIKLNNGSDAEETFTIASLTPDDALCPNGPGTIVSASTATVFAYSVGQLATADAFAPTLEAHLKPKSLDVFTDRTVPIAKNTTWVEVTKEEMSDDVRGADVVDRRLMGKAGRNEDKDLLYGEGASGETLGFMKNTLIPLFLWSLSGTGNTKLDFIIDLCYSLTQAEHICSSVLINPNDHRDIIKLKGDDGHYVYWKVMTEGAPMRIFGAQIISTTAINAGDVLAGDFPIGATFYPRDELEIFIGEPNDFFLRNVKAVLVENRYGVNHDIPLAFARGSFDSEPS